MLSKESQRTSKFSWAQLCSFTNVTLKPFFSHIKQTIGDVETIFGSDEEKAINKAIHNVFPNATHLLCTKHMKDNIRRNLKDGCSREEREKIIQFLDPEQLSALVMKTRRLWTFIYKAFAHFSWNILHLKSTCGIYSPISPGTCHSANQQANYPRPIDKQ